MKRKTTETSFRDYIRQKWRPPDADETIAGCHESEESENLNRLHLFWRRNRCIIDETPDFYQRFGGWCTCNLLYNYQNYS